ncbi:MAG: haloacid dehalogenase-like hydrolase [Clostridia bacterium]|nr:haloacid dehalogenase-like hydrolase [Clostridia bacterium]
MNQYVEKRKHKENKPVVAICYDFDRTLSPEDMQAQGYIQSCEYDINEFWTESNNLATNNDMDQNLAYMYMMVEKAEGKVVVNRERLAEYGAGVTLFPGVKEWFERIKKYGIEKGVIVEHYIISSGLKEMIEGTEIAKQGVFEKIYASSFYFNERGAAKWPAQVVNYTNKTQFLFRIQKGVLDINDQGVNDSFEADEIRVPFRNMIYIGDSDTDIPCMKLVTMNGGHSIAVYDPETKDKSKAYKMMREKRIKFYAPADYSEGKELDLLVKDIIDRTAANEKLESLYYRQKKEQITNDEEQGEEARNKVDLINSLRISGNFAYTHTVIAQLNKYDNWTNDEREDLFEIAVHNRQVYCILHDTDVKNFYQNLLSKSKSLSENAKIVRDAMEE